MKRIQITGLVIVTILALSAAGATSALAVNKFLLNGAEITAQIPVLIETGAFLLEDMSALGKPDILCSYFIDGTISAGGKTGSLTEVLTLAGGAGNTVECTDDNGMCSSPVLVTAKDLPWLLVADFSDPEHPEEGKNPEFSIDCNTIIGLVEDLCTGPIGAVLTNLAGGGILAELSESSEAITPAMNCTLGGAKTGLMSGSFVLTSTSGTLALSE